MHPSEYSEGIIYCVGTCVSFCRRRDGDRVFAVKVREVHTKPVRYLGKDGPMTR